MKYEGKKYVDNYLTYFKGLSDMNENKEIKWELFALITGVICFIFYKFFWLRIIEHLTPVHLIFSFPIFYVFNKVYLLLLNYFKSSRNFWFLKLKYAEEKLSLDLCSDILSIIGYLIYLEIIELHCCKYDYNIRRNILDRGIIDIEKAELSSTHKSVSGTETEKVSVSSSENKTSVSRRDIENEN